MIFRSNMILRLAHDNRIDTINIILPWFVNHVRFSTYITERNDQLKRIEAASRGYLKSSRSDIIKTRGCANISSDVSIISKFGKLEQEENNVVLLNRNITRVDDALEDISEELPGPLDTCNEDISHIGPYCTPTFTYAKYANKSQTLKELIKLGVKLYRLETDKEVMEMLLRLDFEKDVKPYIQFLYDCGVPPSEYGKYITKNPKFFNEDLDDLHTRVRYLRAHEFSKQAIQSIVSRNPFWLSMKTNDIDSRLGHFQNDFQLKGYEVRYLAAKCPKLITYKMQHIRKNTFAVREEMGFDRNETKLILIKKPYIWIKNGERLVNSFDYAHNQMKLSHTILSKQPQVLLCRRARLEQRHKFLVELKRDQYDPTKPMYISPKSLIEGNDIEFCRNIAKCHTDTYNIFLKSL